MDFFNFDQKKNLSLRNCGFSRKWRQKQKNHPRQNKSVRTKTEMKMPSGFPEQKSGRRKMKKNIVSKKVDVHKRCFEILDLDNLSTEREVKK